MIIIGQTTLSIKMVLLPHFNLPPPSPLCLQMSVRDPIQQAMDAGIDDLTIDKNGRGAKRPASYTRCTIPQRRDSVRRSLGSKPAEEAVVQDATVETTEEKIKEVCV